jgi:hypothetical protein
MIEQTAPTTAMHRVECKAGRPKLISNVLPTGWSVWCQQCRLVHYVQLSEMPSRILHDFAHTIDMILSDRGEIKDGRDLPT